MKKIILSAIWMLLMAACVSQEPADSSDSAEPEQVEGRITEPAVPEVSEPAPVVKEKPKKRRSARVVKREKKSPGSDPKAASAKSGEPENRDGARTLVSIESPAVDYTSGAVTAPAADEWDISALAEHSPSHGKLSAGSGDGSGYGEYRADESQIPAFSRPKKQNRFLPMSRRIDRGINRGRFAYKGELVLGLTASYGTMSNDDTDFLVILDNIDLDGTMATVKPFVGYFYRNNRCVGLRFGYQHMGGKLGNVDLDLGDQNDISMNIGGMELSSDSYSFGLFHRSYVGLDRRGRFGLFAEVEASVTTGTSDFINGTGESAKATYSDNFKAKLAFNPGLAVYIFPNVCTTVSIGLGGLQYSSVTQRDAQGNETGSRKASKMQFRINIADINLGVSVHLWDKKKR